MSGRSLHSGTGLPVLAGEFLQQPEERHLPGPGADILAITRELVAGGPDPGPGGQAQVHEPDRLLVSAPARARDPRH